MQVPEGLASGQQFTVAAPDGQQISVTVPPGVAGGAVIQVGGGDACCSPIPTRPLHLRCSRCRSVPAWSPPLLPLPCAPLIHQVQCPPAVQQVQAQGVQVVVVEQPGGKPQGTVRRASLLTSCEKDRGAQGRGAAVEAACTPARSHTALTAAQTIGPYEAGRWKFDIFDFGRCFSCKGDCLMAWCCQCFPVAQIAGKLMKRGVPSSQACGGYYVVLPIFFVAVCEVGNERLSLAS